jgi:hypothetical protein
MFGIVRQFRRILTAGLRPTGPKPRTQLTLDALEHRQLPGDVLLGGILLPGLAPVGALAGNMRGTPAADSPTHQSGPGRADGDGRLTAGSVTRFVPLDAVLRPVARGGEAAARAGEMSVGTGGAWGNASFWLTPNLGLGGLPAAGSAVATLPGQHLPADGFLDPHRRRHRRARHPGRRGQRRRAAADRSDRGAAGRGGQGTGRQGGRDPGRPPGPDPRARGPADRRGGRRPAAGDPVGAGAR